MFLSIVNFLPNFIKENNKILIEQVREKHIHKLVI